MTSLIVKGDAGNIEEQPHQWSAEEHLDGAAALVTLRRFLRQLFHCKSKFSEPRRYRPYASFKLGGDFSNGRASLPP
jgi:hypothetical protein